MSVIKVASKSDPNAVAWAIIGALKDMQEVDVKAVGAAAINQSIKAIAISRSELLKQNEDLACAPSFTDVPMGNKIMTAITLKVFKKSETISNMSDM